MIKDSLKVKKKNISNDEAGAALIGYSILVAVIAVTSIASVTEFGDKVAGKHWCKAIAGLHDDFIEDQGLWNDAMWDEDNNACDIRYDVHFGSGSCIGWPCD